MAFYTSSRHGGFDNSTDWSDLKLDDAEIARKLQDAEFDPTPSRITAAPAPAPPAYAAPARLDLNMEQARTRSANILRANAERELQNERAARLAAERRPVLAIPLYSDTRFDSLYTWSLGLIPEFEYAKQLRLRLLLEELIRKRLRLGEPEYLLKDEIRDFIGDYLVANAVRAKKTKKAAPKAKARAKKAPSAKKKRSKKAPASSKRRLTNRSQR